MKGNIRFKFRWFHGEDAKVIPPGCVVVRRSRAVNTSFSGGPRIINKHASYDVVYPFNPEYVERQDYYGTSYPHGAGGTTVKSYMWIKDKP